MECRHAASVNACMTYRRDGGYVVDNRVLATETLVEKALEAALAPIIIIGVEIVPSHLVHYDAYYQFGPSGLCRGQSSAQKRCNNKKIEFFHLCQYVMMVFDSVFSWCLSR